MTPHNTPLTPLGDPIRRRTTLVAVCLCVATLLALAGCSVGGESVEHEAGQAWGEDRVAVVHPPHGIDQILTFYRLRHIPTGSASDYMDNVGGGVGYRQGQETGGYAALHHTGDYVGCGSVR